MRTTWRFALIIGAVVLSVLEGSAARAAPTLPVPYGNEAMLRIAVTQWNAPTQGADDYSCKPTPTHPRPVVLVGSTYLSAGVNWTTLAPFLRNAGFCVFTLDYGSRIYRIPPGLNGMDPLVSSAGELDRLVRRVTHATGTPAVDFVGHSQGGIVVRYYLNQIASQRDLARTVVLMSSPYTMTGPIDFGELLRAHAPASVRSAAADVGAVAPFPLSVINPWEFGKAQRLLPRVRYVQVTDVADEMGILGGMRPPRGANNASTEVINDYCASDFSQHFAQPYSRVAVALVHNALSPKRPVAVPCAPVPLYSLN